MSDQPLVSIIIPTYNRAHLIGETLDTVVTQTYLNWECIIVDDGSSDNTDQVIEEYTKKDSRFKYYHRPDEHLPGGNGARNYGFKMSQGEYIQWFDSDDLMVAEKLELKVKAMLENEVDFVVCFGALVNKKHNVIDEWNKIYNKNALLSHVLGIITFSTNGPMFKKSILLNNKVFDEKLKRKQEWEFFSRILCETESYYPLNVVLYYIKRTDDSINVRNEVKSINSKVLANILVYKEVRKKRKDIIDINFKRHFLNKFIYNFRFALRESEYNALLLSLFGIIIAFDRMFLVRFFDKKYWNKNI
jgi:glycosyltransferase involved in cell wall biosynthesis